MKADVVDSRALPETRYVDFVAESWLRRLLYADLRRGEGKNDTGDVSFVIRTTPLLLQY
jgi:hypothetical protein